MRPACASLLGAAAPPRARRRAACRRHRAPLGPAGRYPGRGRLPGRADPPQRRQGDPAALPQPRRQERCLATPTCWPTCCAPTAHASSPCSRSPTRSVRCARWCADATTWWPPACSWPTSCAACSSRSGPAPPRSSPTSTRRSRLAFVQRYPTPAAPPRCGEKRLAALPRPASLLRPTQSRRACSNACAPPRRPRRRTGDRCQGRPRAQRSPARLSTLVEQIAAAHRAHRARRRRTRPTASIVMSLAARRTRVRRADPRRAGRCARALPHRRSTGRRGRRRAR